jgi:hypothetical protein
MKAALDNNLRGLDGRVQHGRVQRAFRRLNRSHVLYINGILPVSDFLCLLLAAYLAAHVDPSWLAKVRVEHHGYLAVLIALLGAFFLYDRRFGSIAIRGKSTALIRYYVIGFAKFLGCTLLMGAASRAFAGTADSMIAAWLGLSLLFTGLTRLLLAANVRRLARSGILTEVVAIVGAGPLAERLGRHLRQRRPVSIDLLGVFDVR